MKKKIDLTFIIIAYNEEGGLRKTLERILHALEESNVTADILIMNDGSTDGTRKIADTLVSEHPNLVRSIHKAKNQGQYKNIIDGVHQTQTKYFTIIPGDDQFLYDCFPMYLKFLGKYDFIFGFPNNEFEARGRKRTVLSHCWRLYLLALYGISVTYLAGFLVAPTKLVKEMKAKNSGFLGWYETAVRCILSGATYMQLPFTMKDRDHGETKAFNPLRNLLDLFRMLKVWRLIKGDGILSAGKDYHQLQEKYLTYKQSL